MKLIVTIDVEEDSGPRWECPPISRFVGVTEGIKNRLQPLFRDLGVKPTLLLSPIVLESDASTDVLGQLEHVELGTHLHWEQCNPGAVRTLQGGPAKNWVMQQDYPAEAEFEKLEYLTGLFRRKFGYKPTSFRAGRYGASKSTGALLKRLGYEVDTSATPNVKWPTVNKGWIDYTSVPEHPYTIGEPGNIYEPGDFDFLEVPITIVSNHDIPGKKPSWFRPAYTGRETLKEIARVVRARNASGCEQPLVMMFHNVEVIANASPYCATEEDVCAYLEDMRESLSYAIELGFEPCTLTEYARGYKTAVTETRNKHEQNLIREKTLGHDNSMGFSLVDVEEAVNKYGANSWHLYIFKERNRRWDVVAACDWARGNISKSASILSAGCGMGFNLYWLERNGFRNLKGFDIGKANIEASLALKRQYGSVVDLWDDDFSQPRVKFSDQFDYIEAMNCLMYTPDSYTAFLFNYAKALKPGGYLAIDFIDASYNAMPNNQWFTADWEKPIAERRPNEYVARFSQSEVIRLLSSYGLNFIDMIKPPPTEALPRFIYIFQRPAGQLDRNGVPHYYIGIHLDDIKEVIEKYHVDPWHLYIYEDRKNRWDVTAICHWAKTHIPDNAAILSVGCGMGLNLYWLEFSGFTNLKGFDRDKAAITASLELKQRLGRNIDLWTADFREPQEKFREQFDYIEAMNCLMYEAGSYELFLENYVKALKPRGFLAFDAIDVSYNAVPGNEWAPGDANKPLAERKPDSYRVRLSEAEVMKLADRYSLILVGRLEEADPVPRIIYVFRKN